MKYKVTLNQKVYEVEVEAGKAVLLDEYEACAPAPAAAPAAEAAPAAAAAPAPAPAAKVDLKAGEPVKSPMPGNIIRVEVEEGDQIKAGQLLVVLEAMKMETTFVSKVNGKVDKLYVAPGDRVNTEDLLVSFILDEEE